MNERNERREDRKKNYPRNLSRAFWVYSRTVHS